MRQLRERISLLISIAPISATTYNYINCSSISQTYCFHSSWGFAHHRFSDPDILEMSSVYVSHVNFV